MSSEFCEGQFLMNLMLSLLGMGAMFLIIQAYAGAKDVKNMHVSRAILFADGLYMLSPDGKKARRIRKSTYRGRIEYFMDMSPDAQVSFIEAVNRDYVMSWLVASVGGFLFLLIMVVGDYITKCMMCGVCTPNPLVFGIPLVFLPIGLFYSYIISMDISICPGKHRSMSIEEIDVMKNLCKGLEVKFFKGFCISIPKKNAEACIPRVIEFIKENNIID